MSKVKDNYELCSDITDLIISLIKKRDLKDYIWKTYTNINDKLNLKAMSIFLDKDKKFCPEPDCNSYLKKGKDKYVKCENGHQYCYIRRTR